MPLTAYSPHRMGAGLQMATRYPPHACGSLKLTYSVHEDLVSKTFTTPSPPLPLPPPPVFHRTNCYPLFIYPCLRSVHGKLIVPLDIHLSSPLVVIASLHFSHVACTPITLPILPTASSDVCAQVVCNRRFNKTKCPCERTHRFRLASCLPFKKFHLIQVSQAYKQLSGSITGTSAQGERRYCKRQREEGGR